MVLSLLLIGFQQWVDPALTEAHKLAAETQRDRETGKLLLAQQAALAQRLNSANATQLLTLTRLRRSFAEQEPHIQAVQKSLVPAKDMTAFLENLLKGNKSLRLLSLETLSPEALASADEEGARKKAATSEIKLYKHGVRLRLSGGYRELTAYLDDLERASQRVLWGDMKLSVKDHPKVELTLTVYTLSLDKAWMTL